MRPPSRHLPPITPHMADRNFIRPIDLSPAASGTLDLIRSLAALAVMLGHARGLFFVDYGHIAPALTTIPVKLLYFLTGFGHQSVMVFFVLSGLLISSSIFRNFNRHTWSWRNYAVDRCVRLYLVLLPGLLLGAFWDHLGIRFFNANGLYSAPLVPFGDGIPDRQLAASIFLGNLAFLQTRFTPILGSNGPLWSLFNEFWYYALFPLLLCAVLSARRRSAKFMAYAAMAAFVAWILNEALSGFLIWVAGACVGLTASQYPFPETRKLRARIYAACTLALTVICLLASRENGGWLGSDLAIGISFALLVHRLAQLRGSKLSGSTAEFGLRFARTFASFSYSLYVLHFPLFCY